MKYLGPEATGNTRLFPKRIKTGFMKYEYVLIHQTEFRVYETRYDPHFIEGEYVNKWVNTKTEWLTESENFNG